MKKALIITGLLALWLCACGDDADSGRGRLSDREETAKEPEKEEPAATAAAENVPSPTDAGLPSEDVVWEPVSEETLARLQDTSGNYNGFFLSAYSCPEMIDWNQVCYNGAGIDIQVTDELRDFLTAEWGEIYTDVTAIHTEDLEYYVRLTTGTEYACARRPLNWEYFPQKDLYVFEHGDTNYMPVTFTRGEANGDIYRLYYYMEDWQAFEEREFVVTAQVSDSGEWIFLSNLQTDTPAMQNLLSMDFYTDKADLAAYAPKDYVEVKRLASDEDSTWYWVLLFALQDDTRIILDRADVSTDLGESLVWENFFLPGDNLYSTTLNAGESVAVKVNLPWNPRIHLTAASGNYYGEYFFGEDNWRHLETDTAPLPTTLVIGHDFDAEGRGTNPRNNLQFLNMFAGNWVTVDDNGEPTALVSFDDVLTITDMDNYYVLGYTWENILSKDGGIPDGISLYCYDEDVLPEIPFEGYDPNRLGDYLISLTQLDGEQILTITQANNGDGVLSYALEGTDPTNTSFELHRYTGVAQEENN
ncbi:MAG: hypothetical protein IJ600_02785 [Lachnospiraceae bacterium]|nr:hypothetical protein [Lachnospiraceae bacterium]